MNILQRGLTLGFIVRASVRWSWALGSVSNHSAIQIAPPRDETKEEALAPVFAGERSSRRALFRGMRLAGWRQGNVAREGARHFVTWWLTPTENKQEQRKIKLINL